MVARFAGFAEDYYFRCHRSTDYICSFLRCLSIFKFLFCTLAVWTRFIGVSAARASVVLVEANLFVDLKLAVEKSYGSV